MSGRKTPTLPESLSKARLRFDRWRSRNRSHRRLPEDLWSAAAELARDHGVNRTAKALRLDYYSLKKRIAGDGAERAPEFVEILPGTAPVPSSGCTIEIEDGSGASLRIRVQGPELPDIPACLTAIIAGRASIARALRGGEA